MDATVFEINTVQAMGAVGESVAAGIIFTFPALIFLGFTLDITKTFVVALAGGSLVLCFLTTRFRLPKDRERGTYLLPQQFLGNNTHYQAHLCLTR